MHIPPAPSRLYSAALGLLGLLLVYTALQPLTSGFTVSPGGDTLAHYQTIAALRDQGLSFGELFTRPIAFQSTVLGIHNLTSWPIETVYRILAALALPLSAFSVSLLAGVLFGRKYALLTLLFAGFVSLQPWQTYVDGTIPNIYGAGVFFPLVVSFAYLTARQRKYSRAFWWYLVALFLSLTLLLMTHHLTTLVLVATTALWALSCLVLVLSTRALPLRRKIWLSVGIVSGITLLAVAFGTLPIFRAARSIVAVFTDYINQFPYLMVSTSNTPRPVWDTFIFGQDLGGWIYQAAVAGALLLLIRTVRNGLKPTQLVVLFFIAWFSIYFIGAFSGWSGEPTRMARDLAIPGVVLASYFTLESVALLRRYSRVVHWVFIGAVVLVCTPYLQTKARYVAAANRHVQFSPAEEAAFTHLQTTNNLSQTTILTTNFIWRAVLDLRLGTVAAAAQPTKLVPAEGVANTGSLASGITTPCILHVRYLEPVLAATPTTTQYEELVTTQPFSVRQQFTDDRRVVTWSCR